MSRVGKVPVIVPQGVQVTLDSTEIVVKGKLGELNTKLNDLVKVAFTDGKITVAPANDSKESRSMWGTLRNLIKNMVQGVDSGFEVRLEIKGVGFKASTDNKILTLSLGYSHDIKYAIPTGIAIKCEKPTLVIISGPDKQRVGQVAGELIKLRPVEPYKGKGVFIEGSYIVRKVGKKK